MGIAIVPAIASGLALLALWGYGLTERMLKEMAVAARVVP
jgi:hypothetical protein